MLQLKTLYINIKNPILERFYCETCKRRLRLAESSTKDDLAIFIYFCPRCNQYFIIFKMGSSSRRSKKNGK